MVMESFKCGRLVSCRASLRSNSWAEPPSPCPFPLLHAGSPSPPRSHPSLARPSPRSSLVWTCPVSPLSGCLPLVGDLTGTPSVLTATQRFDPLAKRTCDFQVAIARFRLGGKPDDWAIKVKEAVSSRTSAGGRRKWADLPRRPVVRPQRLRLGVCSHEGNRPVPPQVSVSRTPAIRTSADSLLRLRSQPKDARVPRPRPDPSLPLAPSVLARVRLQVVRLVARVRQGQEGDRRVLKSQHRQAVPRRSLKVHHHRCLPR